MKGGRAAGFTIVETLIVLAVTMALFLSATALISGKQRTAAFNQSIRAVQTELQQVIGQVSSGYYASGGDIQCDASGTITAGGTDSQGTNQSCVFLGKVLQFHIGTADPGQYYAYTMYGSSKQTDLPFDLAGAHAKVIARSVSASTVDTKNLQYGLTVKSMMAGSNDISAVAIAVNTGTFGAADGSQQLNIVPVTGTPKVTDPLQSDTSAAPLLNSRLASGLAANPDGGVKICFASGGTNQSGLITLGASGQQNAVDLKIYSNGSCT